MKTRFFNLFAAISLTLILIIAGFAGTACNCNGVPPLPQAEEAAGDGGLQKEGAADAAPEVSPEPEVAPEPRPELKPELAPELNPEVPQFGTVVIHNRITNCLYGTGVVELVGPSPTTVTGPTYTNNRAKPGIYKIKLKVADHCQLDRVYDGSGSIIGEVNDFAQELRPGEKIVFNVTYAQRYDAEIATVHSGGIILSDTGQDAVTYFVYGYSSAAAKPLESVTVKCDAKGFGAPGECLAIQQVTVTCDDGKSFTGALVQGRHIFTGMGCIPKKDKDPIQVKVSFKAATVNSGTFALSGIQFKIGLTSDKELWVQNESRLPTFVLRKSLLEFARGFQGDTKFPTSTGTIHQTKVTARGGDASFVHLRYRITTTRWNDSNSDIKGFEFHNRSGKVSGAIIAGLNQAGKVVSLKSPSLGLAQLGSSGIDGIYVVVVVLTNEQIIALGSTETYFLKAFTRGGFTDATMSVKLLGDLAGSKVSHPPCSPNPNTARVYPGFITKAEGLISLSFPNFIWSDRAGGDGQVAKIHTAPDIDFGGNVVAGSGTCDYTNGDLLGIDDMAEFTFKQ